MSNPVHNLRKVVHPACSEPWCFRTCIIRSRNDPQMCPKLFKIGFVHLTFGYHSLPMRNPAHNLRNVVHPACYEPWCFLTCIIRSLNDPKMCPKQFKIGFLHLTFGSLSSPNEEPRAQLTQSCASRMLRTLVLPNLHYPKPK